MGTYLGYGGIESASSIYFPHVATSRECCFFRIDGMEIDQPIDFVGKSKGHMFFLTMGSGVQPTRRDSDSYLRKMY